jgi:hypothetical protein
VPEIHYAHALPRFVRRGRAYTFTLDSLDSDDGTSTAATACTYSLFDEDGSAVIDAEAATITGGIASYSLLSTKLDGRSYSAGYWEEWTATIGGAEYIFEREFYLVRRVPKPTIRDADLVAVHEDILAELPPGLESWAGKRSEAWAQLMAHLIGRGHNPARIRNLVALRPVHIQWTLALVAEDLDTRTSGPGKWTKRAQAARAAVAAHLDSLGLEMDTDDDGTIDEVDAAEPGVYLTTLPRQVRRGVGV